MHYRYSHVYPVKTAQQMGLFVSFGKSQKHISSACAIYLYMYIFDAMVRLNNNSIILPSFMM